MKTRTKMHEPFRTKDKKRNPNLVGMVYEAEDLHPSHADNRIMQGDILLCLEHSGDCHYKWALLKQAEENKEDQYYSIEKIYSAYSIMGKLLIDLDTPLSDTYIKEVLIRHITNNNASCMYLRKADDEIKPEICICCNREI